MTTLIAATCRGYKATGAPFESRGTLSWLTWAERWATDGHAFFLSVQRDGMRSDDMDGLAEIVRSVGGTVWHFSIDEGATEVDNSGRLAGITMGRNLAHEFAQRDFSISHILFVDTDVTPPVNCVERLVSLDHPIVAAHMPTYSRDGPRVESYKDRDVRSHWASAGCLLLRREVFCRLRWRWDLEAGMTDDPCFGADALALGWPTYVDHGLVAEHWPPMIAGFDRRGHSLAIGPDA